MMRSGFSVMEIGISMVLIALLGSAGISGYTSYVTKANIQSQVDQFSQVNSALAEYYADTGTYPMDIKWLFVKPDNSSVGVDAFGYMSTEKLEDEAKEAIAGSWGGPYGRDAAMSEWDTAGNRLKSKYGPGYITLGAAPKKLADDVPYAFNMISISNLNIEESKALFKAINKKELNAVNNLMLETIKGESPNKIAINKKITGTSGYDGFYRFSEFKTSVKTFAVAADANVFGYAIADADADAADDSE
ncbi:MAG: hypothetical protein HOG49_17035 [Candidatus Scalindua sp.]|jgi:type II secretory pathway pseudopilin PulG|nr:hypothetical protein [Candidatus Scalindua sp.]